MGTDVELKLAAPDCDPPETRAESAPAELTSSIDRSAGFDGAGNSKTNRCRL
jgi:hypothetical protein